MPLDDSFKFAKDRRRGRDGDGDGKLNEKKTKDWASRINIGDSVRGQTTPRQALSGRPSTTVSVTLSGKVTKVDKKAGTVTVVSRDGYTQTFKFEEIKTHRRAVQKKSSQYPDLDRSPKKNWVEDAGGLPKYIERIAKNLHYERGMTISHAIAAAITVCRKWAAGGDNVKPDTRAKAQKALAEWEAKKAKTKVKSMTKAEPTSSDVYVPQPLKSKTRTDPKAPHSFSGKLGSDDACSVCGAAKEADIHNVRKMEHVDGDIVKIDKDQRNVFGWAYVTHDENGELNVDKSGEFVDDVEHIEKAAYGFVLKSRTGDVNHTNETCSTLVESMVFTPEKIAKMGLPEGIMPTGWWIGFHIDDDEVWSDVKKGKYQAFSIFGKATKKEVPDDAE